MERTQARLVEIFGFPEKCVLKFTRAYPKATFIAGREREEEEEEEEEEKRGSGSLEESGGKSTRSGTMILEVAGAGRKRPKTGKSSLRKGAETR